jgi:hypothetical protein
MSNQQNDIFNEQLLEAYAELQVQAMIFDMDVDIETWTLVPKSTYKEPRWITVWKEKQYGADHDDVDLA